jgi:mRNA-degrading endonuclease toxin of MazEF toxin-antitoxin module
MPPLKTDRGTVHYFDQSLSQQAADEVRRTSTVGEGTFLPPRPGSGDERADYTHPMVVIVNQRLLTKGRQLVSGVVMTTVEEHERHSWNAPWTALIEPHEAEMEEKRLRGVDCRQLFSPPTRFLRANPAGRVLESGLKKIENALRFWLAL